MRTATVALLAAVALAGCKVKVNDEGKLPDVDVRQTGDGGATVSVKPGEMPDVDVSADSSVKVPDVTVPEVKAPSVEVPDVNLPRVDGNDTTRRDTARRG